MPPRTRRSRLTALAAVPDDAEAAVALTSAAALTTLAGVAAAGPYAELPVGQLVVHPRNPRTDLGPDEDLAELTDSIRSRGVLEPLVVVPAGDQVPPDVTHWWVLMGQRRLAAARRAGRTHVPCIVRPDLTDDVDALVDMLVENLHRSSLSPIEEASAYRQLQIEGLDVTAIATRTGRGRSTVDGRLQLLELPEPTRDRVHRREVTLDQAAALAEHVNHPDSYRRLEEAAGTANWRFELEQARRTAANRAAAAEARAAHEAAGVRIVERGELRGRVVDDYRLQVAFGGKYWERPTAELVAAHAACPGHAVLAPTRAEDPEWLCLQPELHGRSTTPADVAEPDDEGLDEETLAARRAARADRERREAEQLELARLAAEQHRDAVASAAASRAEWLHGMTTGARPLPAAVGRVIARRLATTAVIAYFEVDNLDWAAWLGVDIEEIEDHDVEGIENRLMDVLARRDPHRALLAFLASFNEPNASAPHAWPQNPDTGGMRPGALEWLDCLVELGWQPSAWEAERMATSRPLPAPTPPAAAPAAVDTVQVVDDLL
jgi:ParB/RepB/Spo0J family partition protein